MESKEEVYDDIARLAKEKSVAEIASEVGCSLQTVYKVLQLRDIPTPSTIRMAERTSKPTPEQEWLEHLKNAYRKVKKQYQRIVLEELIAKYEG